MALHADTVLLIESDDIDGSTTFEDLSNSNHTVTASGSAEHSTDQQKFGDSSLYFPASSDYISAPDSADWNVGADDFTLDFWIKLGSTARQFICGQGLQSGGTANANLVIELQSGGALRLQQGITTGANYILFTPNLTLSDTTAFHHIALVRNGNTLTMYLDGVAGTTTYDLTGITFTDQTGGFVIGRGGEYTSNGLSNAYIDEFRIVNGTAIWTTNFTPPTSPYYTPPATSVTLLDIETGNPVISTPVIDSSEYFFTVFRNSSQNNWKNSSSHKWNFVSVYDSLGPSYPLTVISEDYALKLGSSFEEIFGIKTVNDFEEVYSISFDIITLFEILYGLKLSIDLIEYYKDSPTPKRIVNEYYGDGGNPIRSLVLSYNDAMTPVLVSRELYNDIPSAVKVIWELYNDSLKPTKIVNELYHDAFTPKLISQELYNDISSPKKLFWELYNDSLVSKRIMNETYNDAFVAKQLFNEKYNNALVAKLFVTESYNNSTFAVQSFSEIYGIADSGVQNVFNESYDIRSLNEVQNYFDEWYYLVPDTTITDSVEASIEVEGVEIDFIGIDLEISIDQYVILGSITVADEATYVTCKFLDSVVCTIDSETYNLFIENKTKVIKDNGISYQIDIVSPTVKLDAPYSKTLIQSFPNGISAKSLVEQMADTKNISIDYQLVDWFLPSYSISIKDETPLAVIRRVVNAAGGIVQTKPDGTLLLISKYPVSPKDWDSSSVTEILSSAEHITSLSETLQINNGYNAFLITDQGSSEANIFLKEINVDETTKIIKGFRIPFVDGEFDLETSGGEDVIIDKHTLPVEEDVPIDSENEEEEWEYVEFIEWTGKTQYPIYEVIESDWEEEDLGAFQISEDGTLTIIDQASVPSESLLRIKYKTKYWKWTVKGITGKHVQFYVPEEV